VIAVDRCRHPYRRRKGLFAALVCGLVQSFALFWPQHVQQVKDCVAGAYEEHVVLTVDAQVVTQKDGTVVEENLLKS
jgi:hypothetical protein